MSHSDYLAVEVDVDFPLSQMNPMPTLFIGRTAGQVAVWTGIVSQKPRTLLIIYQQLRGARTHYLLVV